MKKSLFNHGFTVGLGAAVIALSSTTTIAQSPLLEEVLVTAQKREQSASDIGMAISTFSGDNLKTLGVSDTRDLAGLIPGFTAAKSDLGTTIYTLRGVGYNSPNLSSTSPVGVYVDEASFPYPYMSHGLSYDLERVEVLKGPQGTIYGRNTTGGLVNFITKRPTNEFEAGFTVHAGSYEKYGIEGFVSGPLSESWGARLAIKSDKSDKGWQKSFSRPGERNGEEDRFAARMLLDYDADDRLRAQLTFNYWQDKGDTQAGQAVLYNPGADEAFVAPGFENEIISNPDNEDADWASSSEPGAWPGTTFTNQRPELGLDSQMSSVTARLEFDLTDTLTLVSLTNYADLERDDVSDRGGVKFEIAVDREVGSIESFSQELRLAGSSVDEKTNFIGGLYYSRDKLDDRGQIWAGQNSVLNELRAYGYAVIDDFPDLAAEVFGGFRNWENFTETTFESYAVFGQFDHQLSDTLTLTAGARYTEESHDFAGCSRDLNGDTNIHQVWNFAFETALVAGDCVTFDSTTFAPVGPEGAKKDLDEDNVSWRVALDWQPTDEMLVYGSISKGFKSGSFPQISANASAQLDPATEEELLAYELGAKFSPSSFLDLNAAVYFYDYKDKQVYGLIPDPIFVTLTKVVNVPESEVYGAEFDATVFPTEDTFVKFSASYLQTEIKKYQGYDSSGADNDFAGDSFAYSPDWQFNMVGAHRFDINDKFEGTVVVDASYSDKQSSLIGDDSTRAVDSYTLVGARLVVEPKDGRWEAALFGRNLTDEYYWSASHGWGDAIVRYAGMPRTYGVELSYNF
jgi:outer membrane receptor protein involved in Fe transport